ncbi:MAG: hypothetical protein MJY50_00275 [Bacteroidales bacterium]|nr:hypothetical protein [Bacteroidales bacterium]
MKKFFTCLTVIIAALACGVSCDKDNSGNQSESGRKIISEAVEAASREVFDKDGERAGMAVFINPYGNEDALMGVISLARQMEDNAPLFMKDNSGAPVKIDLINFLSPQVSLCFFLGSDATRKVSFVRSLRAMGSGMPTAEWMIDISKINGPDALGQDSKAFMTLKDVEDNLDKHPGMFFLHLAQSHSEVYVKGIDEVKFTMSDGPDGKTYFLSSVDTNPQENI